MTATPLRTLLEISLGGVTGAALRYGLTSAWPTPAGSLPWPTLTINVIGCAVLGGLLGALAAGAPWARWRHLLGTGLLAGFTTFSTFAVETAALLRDGAIAVAATYTVTTLVLGVLATVAGEVTAQRFWRWRHGATT